MCTKSSIYYPILLGLISLIMVSISNGKPPSELDLLDEMPNSDYLVHKMVKNAGNDGKTFFLGTENNRPAPPGPYRLIVYDHKEKKYSELLSAQEIQTLIQPYGSFSIIEMAIDLSHSVLVIDIISKVEIKNDKACTALLIVDLKSKKKVHEISDSRYHIGISLSPGGRYLAFRSHPDTWMNAPYKDMVLANRVDLLDLKTKVLKTLSPDCKGIVNTIFFWADDAGSLLFLNRDGNLPTSPYFLYKLTTASSMIDRYELKNKDVFLGDLHIFPDGKVVFVSSQDISMLDEHLKYYKHLFKGQGVRLHSVEGNKVKFYDQEGKPGMGVLKEVSINP